MKGVIDTHLGELRLLLLEVSASEARLSSMCAAFKGAATIYVCGNGGSDANAAHLALHLQEAGLRCRSILDDSPYLTALSNDHSYASVPLRVLRNQATPKDVLVVISGSGDSDNILVALAEARRIGMVCLGLLGFGGGAAAGLCALAVILSSKSYGPVEDAHSAIIHIFATTLRSTPG